MESIKYYRLVSEDEISKIVGDHCLRTTENVYPPYKSGEIVCLLSSNDLGYLVQRYGTAIADLRDLKSGQILYILEISDPPGVVEEDRSQFGWENSMAHCGDIPIDSIRIAGHVEIEEVKSVKIFFKKSEIYKVPKKLNWKE